MIGPQRFRAVVLPPISTINSNTLKKLLELFPAGGTIIGIRELPDAAGVTDDDFEVIQQGIEELFGSGAAGTTPHPLIENHI